MEKKSLLELFLDTYNSINLGWAGTIIQSGISNLQPKTLTFNRTNFIFRSNWPNKNLNGK